MILFMVFCQAFLTAAACPETIVIKNVNWKNTPPGDYLHQEDWNVDTINGKSESLKLNKLLFLRKIYEDS